MIESVRFKTYDGVELVANLHLPDKHDQWSPGIIVCHGFGSGKDNYASFGTLAAEAGYAVLIPDLRGHGESDKPPGASSRGRCCSYSPRATR